MTKDIGIGTQTWPLQITFRTYVLVRPRRIPDLHGQLQLIPEDDLPDTQALSFCGSVVIYSYPIYKSFFKASTTA